MIRIAAISILLLIPGVAVAQSLANSLATVALQRCVAAAETGAAPKFRALFPGELPPDALPSDIFVPATSFFTSDGRIYLALDMRGNCAVGDLQADKDGNAHATAIRRFEAWAASQVADKRYLDSGLEETTYAYRRTFVFREPTNTPLLVSMISDQGAGILAVVAERAVPVDGPAEPAGEIDTSPNDIVDEEAQRL